MVMPAAGPVIVTVVMGMGMAVSMAMPMVITARFAVRMIVPVVVGMPMVMVAAAAGVVMRVGRMAQPRRARRRWGPALPRWSGCTPSATRGSRPR